MRQFAFRPAALLAIALTAAVTACGPGELATPTASQVETLIREQFPQAEIRVREVARSDQELRVPAEFNGADVIFVLAATADAWSVQHVEQGGSAYTVEQLGDIATSMAVMRDISDALEAYQQANGNYPLLDDQVGLRELVPDFYPADAPMQDAWGTPLRYRIQGDDYIVTSTGPDAELATSDDIILITGTFVQGQ